MYRVLIVDDEPINLEIIKDTLAEEDLELETAENGQVALNLISESSYDLILLDRMMPVMDGITLLRAIKAVPAWRDVPVVMQTAAASPSEVKEGIEAGAHYYLTKPYEPDALRILTLSILADVGKRRKARAASDHLGTLLRQLNAATWKFRTLAEASALAGAVSTLCPEPDLALTGLSELLVNAVEHGNLSLGYQAKTEMKWAGRWEDEIERRLADPVFRSHVATLQVEMTPDHIVFTVQDQGNGFDWTKYLEFSADRAFDLHGRGIAMAKAMSFSELEYQGRGNIVVAKVKRTPEPGQTA